MDLDVRHCKFAVFGFLSFLVSFPYICAHVIRMYFVSFVFFFFFWCFLGNDVVESILRFSQYLFSSHILIKLY